MRSVKVIFVFVLMFGILCQIAGKLVVVIGFEMNKEYIVKNLCVQKNKKKNCCQGSCHLKKELEKQDEEDKSAGNQQKIKLEDQCCTNLFLFAGNKQMENEVCTMLISQQLAGFSAAIFHPPTQG